jgi:hypothetical protein
MIKHSIKDLIEQEKLLYLEVEQLRYRLYLHDSSLIFEFFSAFYFTYQDIKKIFIKKGVEKPLVEIKKLSILSLKKKKKSLILLSYTPYAWIIFLTRKIKNSIPHQKKPTSYNLSKVGSRRNIKSFLIFGSTSENDLQSRSVQIANKLSEKNRVIYIEGIFDEGRKPGFRVIEDTKNKIVIRLTARQSLHFNYQKPDASEITFLKRSFHHFVVSTLKRSNVQLYIHHPFWNSILTPKKNSFYFERTDNYAEIGNAAKHIFISDKKLTKNATKITASHVKLLRNKKDILIKNGVEWNMFKETSKMIQTCDVGLCWIKKPVMGYIGTLDEKIDEILLAKLASAFPTASIVLVGNTDYRPVIEVAEKFANIFPVGIQPYKKLPLFLQSFDILITPFKSFPEGSANHPELPLYLASGKPILSTSQVNRGQLLKNSSRQFIYFSKNHSDWVLSVAEALKEKKKSKKKYLRIATAKKLKWRIPL